MVSCNLHFFKRLLLIGVCVTSFFSHAAEMRLNVSGTYRTLHIEGQIEAGDYERFLKIAKESQGDLSGIWLYSAGGDFMEAIKIGRAMRALELSSNVPMLGRDGRPVCDAFLGFKPPDPANCTAASAAFFIHIGGMHRGGTYLAVHRPYFSPERLKQVSQSEAQGAYDLLQREARAYMNEMGLPPHIQEEVLNTPSDQIRVLDEKTVRTHIWGDLPYRYEWRRAKCAKLTTDQEQQMSFIGGRLLAGKSLSADESDVLKKLSPLRDEQSRCDIALTVESRKAAYEKFFGSAPSDIANHNFGKWLDGPSYLGRTFEEVASEERFEPEKDLMLASYMKRNQTSSAPTAQISDTGGKKRFVTWISMTHENPSPQFVKALKATLEKAWGKASPQKSIYSNNAEGWSKPKFTATLVDRTDSPRPSIGLVVQQSP